MPNNENTNLNEGVEMVVEDAGVITTPIDDTLTVSGAAADAKAVGDALDLKADKSEIQTQIKVNGQTADAQGLILVNAGHIPMSSESGAQTVAEAIDGMESQTAADIPMSDAAGAQTIAEAIAAIGEKTADAIRMSGADSRTVKAAIDSMANELTQLAETIEGLDEKTASDIPYEAGSTVSTHAKIAAIDAAAVRSVNGILPAATGDVAVERVPYADNLSTDDMNQIDGTFIRRTAGGSGSLQDGNAWALRIMGNRVHDGFVPESLSMTVIPMPRPVPEVITATLDEATFEAYVSGAGTYTLSYDGTAWSANPASYGLTISNEPLDGDVITITWDGTNDAVVTISAVPRVAPAAITATIDRDVFVAYVNQSGTYTLTYTTDWSEDPALYGITVTGDPLAGDQIRVVYVKEIRGTIRVATPSRLVATGWNLYESAEGYARVVRYSDQYGYRIDGSYTALAFAETLSGDQTAITPDSSGLFNVTGDGYVFVDGAGSDTAIYTTWSDWTGGTPDSYQAYTESSVPLSAILSGNFPYGLCRVGDTRDEIDMGTKTAISRITRMAYSAENLESARASGRAFEYDENYIYIVRATPVSSAITVEEEYTVSEHGLEYFDGTAVAVYAEILYGTNLKDKLKRDVLTISAQQLTDAQKIQARNNIGAVSQALESGLAILANGDTHAAITAGQRVYVRNHSTLTEGLYKATAAIQTNGPLSTSNLTTEPSGALNDLKGQVDSLNSNLMNKLASFKLVTATSSSGGTVEIPIESITLGFLIGYYRSDTSSSKNGYAILYLYNGTLYITAKTGLSEIQSIAYANNKITITSTSGYMTFALLKLY